MASVVDFRRDGQPQRLLESRWRFVTRLRCLQDWNCCGPWFVATRLSPENFFTHCCLP
jgi:hypothetical protein